jgi:hypothetical protein
MSMWSGSPGPFLTEVRGNAIKRGRCTRNALFDSVILELSARSLMRLVSHPANWLAWRPALLSRKEINRKKETAVQFSTSLELLMQPLPEMAASPIR